MPSDDDNVDILSDAESDQVYMLRCTVVPSKTASLGETQRFARGGRNDETFAKPQLLRSCDSASTSHIFTRVK